MLLVNAPYSIRDRYIPRVGDCTGNHSTKSQVLVLQPSALFKKVLDIKGYGHLDQPVKPLLDHCLRQTVKLLNNEVATVAVVHIKMDNNSFNFSCENFFGGFRQIDQLQKVTDVYHPNKKEKN